MATERLVPWTLWTVEAKAATMGSWRREKLILVGACAVLLAEGTVSRHPEAARGTTATTDVGKVSGTPGRWEVRPRRDGTST